MMRCSSSSSLKISATVAVRSFLRVGDVYFKLIKEADEML